MRKLAIAMALASTVLATPAIARDNSGYIGLEVGPMIVEDYEVGFSTVTAEGDIEINHNVGYDVDLIGGYDFGTFRLEGELAYKRASVDELGFSDDLQNEQLGGFFAGDGHVRTISGMINGLVDFGDDDGWTGYIGAGVGIASVRYNAEVDDVLFGTPGSPLPNPPLTEFDLDDSDSGLAWQLLAGIRVPVSQQIDVGLKYRFFNTKQLHFNDVADEPFDLSGRWRSHSLLLSLIFNFAPPPPPPPPPAAPATQTCPDGTVILATDACPVPPPPPPPPPPAPERGL